MLLLQVVVGFLGALAGKDGRSEPGVLIDRGKAVVRGRAGFEPDERNGELLC